MGIFTRFRDIVSSNINSMLDRAENPEKMIKLMIREMEDTLVELKASCASVLAGKKKLQRNMETVLEKTALWAERAKLAVAKNRDDLAREAIIEKRRYEDLSESLEKEMEELEELITQYHDDIGELEDKLNSAKEKKRSLVQRHKRATTKKRAHTDIRNADSIDTMVRFDKLESRIEQMEAEADLASVHPDQNLDNKFSNLAQDEEIEKELEIIKRAQYNKGTDKQ